jgi:hypothetical protein
MPYLLGALIGALVITGVMSALVVRYWKRPMLASLAVGLGGTVLYYFGAGVLTPVYLIAGLVWGCVWTWRGKKRGEA